MHFNDSESDISGRSTPYVDTPATELSESPSSDNFKGNRYFGKSSSNLFNTYPPVKNICCIGAGYVGGPTAAVIALKNPGIIVNVADLNAARIRKWNSKHPPVHEPGLIDVVRVARGDTMRASASSDEAQGTITDTDCRRQANLFFTTEVQKCVEVADIILMSVNTPTKMSGIGSGSATDLVALESAVSSVALWAKPGAIIVEKSTVPCRTAEMVRRTLDIHRPGVPFEVLSNPEFLAEGTAIKDLLNPDRILIGSVQTPKGLAAAEALKNVYSAWVDRKNIITVNLWSSELAKLVANAMLAQRISSINSISAMCEKTGADIDEIAYAIGCDTRLGPKFLKAGLGFGGSCFKKDILNLIYMARSLHLPEVGEYWMQVLKMNDYQRDRFVKTVVSKLNSTLIGKKLAILGWAFKEDTNDTRESPAIEVIRSLLAESPKEIVIFDPGCNPDDVMDEVQQLIAAPGQNLLHPVGPIRVVDDALEACTDANAVLLLTPWDQFRYPAKMQQTVALYESGQVDIPIGDQMAGETAKCDTQAAGRLDQPVEELPCESDCRECARGNTRKGRKIGTSISWERIAKLMKKPNLVFDGRGIVDVPGMEKLGFRVEVIGKVDSRSRLYGYDF